ncbi:carbohydrate kinase family protein [candidate division KSB1 bacterium]|nr:carbohydrate kinase family protein [candidate division KSB1 bacterium]
MEKIYDITVAGHICLDIIPEFPDTGIREISALFKPGKLIRVEGAKISTGGPVSNTGIALSKLGLNVAFMARVGDDYFGKLVIDLLNRQGYAAGISIAQSNRTSYSVAIAPPGIDRIFLHDSGANDFFSSANLNEEIIHQSKIFHFGYPPIMATCYENEGAELFQIFKIAKSAGVVTSLDMALPDPNSDSGKTSWQKILTKVLPYVDIFLPSIEEVYFMLDQQKYFEIKEQAGDSDIIEFIHPNDYQRLAQKCLDMGCKIVALKTAYRGYYILTNKITSNDIPVLSDSKNWSYRELWCPAFRVERIASATGSGDSSIAGFLAALVKGYPVEKVLKYANCVGHQNLHELDAVSGIKNWEETTASLEQNKLEMIDMPLEKFGWQLNNDFKVWTSSRNKHF